MTAHSDPYQYNNIDGTAGGALRKQNLPAAIGGGYPPHTPPTGGGGFQPLSPVEGGKTRETGPAAGTGSPSGCRAVHDFGSQLRAGTLGPCQLASLFRQTVPGYEGHKVATLSEDRSGVDYWLAVTGEPRLVPCQLKIRPYRKRLSDVLVELAHIGPRRVWPGWIQDRPARLFLYYLPVPGKCLSVDGRELHGAWRKHGLQWADHFGVRLARNESYATVSVPVALPEVLAACPSARVLEVRV